MHEPASKPNWKFCTQHPSDRPIHHRAVRHPNDCVMYVCACRNTTTTSMSQNKNNVTGRFKPTFRSYEKSRNSPYTARVNERSTKEVREDPLENYHAWPSGWKNKKDPFFIFKDKTLRAIAMECLDEFEHNYFCVVLEKVPYNVKEKQGKLEEMLKEDPLGLVTIPTDNPLCWTSHRTAPTAGAESTTLAKSTPASTKPAKKPKAKKSGKKDKKSKKKKRRAKKRKAKARAEKAADTADSSAPKDGTSTEKLAPPSDG